MVVNVIPTTDNFINTSTNVNQLSDFTFKVARTSQARKTVPYNVRTHEKERLYQDKMALKMEKSELARETIQLKSYIKSIELDLKKKDDLLKSLTEEFKRTQYPMPNNVFLDPGLVPAEVQALNFFPQQQTANSHKLAQISR